MSRNYLNNLLKLRDHIESKPGLIGVKYFDDNGGCCAVGAMFELTHNQSICTDLKNVTKAFYTLSVSYKDELHKYFEDDFIGLAQEINDESYGFKEDSQKRKIKVIAAINEEIDRVGSSI